MTNHNIGLGFAFVIGLALTTGTASSMQQSFIRAWGTGPVAENYCIRGGNALAPGEMLSASGNGDVLIARMGDLKIGLQLRGWGSNASGVLSWPPAGMDEADCVAAPGLFPPQTLIDVNLSLNGTHAAAIVDSGWAIRTVTCWGSNLHGECDPPNDDGFPLHQIYQVSCGFYSTMALKHNGYVVAWGNNSFGQSSPPSGLDGVVEIAAGGFHALALRSSGTVVGWGAGSGAYDGFFHCDQAKPPEGLSSVVQIAAGGWHSMALRADGTVVCWGAGASPPNHDFQMQQSQPPADLGPCRLIAAGVYSSVAVTMAGEVRRWGFSGNGWPQSICTGQCDVDSGTGAIEQIWSAYAGTIAVTDLDRVECPCDIEPNCSVDGGDLAVLIADWGKARPGTSSDLDQSGAVDAVDLGMILSSWGSCPD